MSSEDRIILDYMAMLNHLSSDLKLRLIMQLTNSLRKEYVERICQVFAPLATLHLPRLSTLIVYSLSR